MSAWSRLKVSMATALLLWLRPRLLRRDDASWVSLLSWGARLVPAARPALVEVIEVLEGGPPGTTLVREMVRDAHPDEIRDLLWGLLAFEPWTPTVAQAPPLGRQQ